MDKKESEDGYSRNPGSSMKRMEPKDDDAHLKKYIMWENKSNICWLDASMALVAHNRVMKKYCKSKPGSRISKIISVYEEAIYILNNSDKNINQRIIQAKAILKNVQESTLQYLQPILKYKTGDPESAFCSLYNLLIQDSDIKHIFDVTWISVKECTDCGHYSESRKMKPVITLSKINSFDPKNPAVVYNCCCNRSDQIIKLLYAGLPPCLIFHFENGAGKEETPPLNFKIQGREYNLTGIMTLEKSQESNVNHFITWIRNPFVNKWLDCNDLNMDIISFSPDFPDIKFQDVYMYIYESFDKLGTIINNKVINIKKSDENIPCIDLSEESDSENSKSLFQVPVSNKDNKNVEISASNLQLQGKESFTKLDRSHPVVGNKQASDKKNIETSFTPSMAISCDKTNLVDNVGNQSDPVKVNNEKNSNENFGTDKSGNFRIDINAIPNVSIPAIINHDGEKINENDNFKTSNLGQILEANKISSGFEDKSENNEMKYKTSQFKRSNAVEGKPLFDNEKEHNFSPNVATLAKNIQNKKLLPKNCFVSSNLLNEKDVNTRNLDSVHSEELVSMKYKTKIKHSDEEQNNSENLVMNSYDEQINDEKNNVNSNSELQKHTEQFLSSAAAINSETGTSYVKLSVRRKKQTNRSIRKIKSMNDADNVSYEESFNNKFIVDSCFSKSPKGKRESKRKILEDYVLSDVLTKKVRKKNVSNTKMDARNMKEEAHNTKAKAKVLKTELKKSRIYRRNSHSSLNSSNEEIKYDFSEQCYPHSVSDADDSNVNSNGAVKILKEFESVLSSHKPSCNCKLESLEEIIDTVVDCTFAYVCKLTQEVKKSNSH